MRLLDADAPTHTDITVHEGGGQQLAPVRLALAITACQLSQLTQYADVIGGTITNAAIGGQSILTLFVAATDEPSYTPAARIAATDTLTAGWCVTGFDYDLVTLSDIAARTNRSRLTIRHYIKGRRATPGPFPPRFEHPGHRGLWDWGSVNTWLHSFDGSGNPGYLPTRPVLDHLNTWLHQHHPPTQTTHTP